MSTKPVKNTGNSQENSNNLHTIISKTIIIITKISVLLILGELLKDGANNNNLKEITQVIMVVVDLGVIIIVVERVLEVETLTSIIRWS